MRKSVCVSALRDCNNSNSNGNGTGNSNRNSNGNGNRRRHPLRVAREQESKECRCKSLGTSQQSESRSYAGERQRHVMLRLPLCVVNLAEERQRKHLDAAGRVIIGCLRARGQSAGRGTRDEKAYVLWATQAHGATRQAFHYRHPLAHAGKNWRAAL